MRGTARGLPHTRAPRQASIAWGLEAAPDRADNPRMLLRLSGALALLAALALPAPARADEAPPPSFFSCQGKKAGDACEGDNGPGKCVAEKCSRLDYSQGTPPRAVESDCLKCRSGSGPSPSDAPIAEPAPKPAAAEQPPATATAGSAPTAAPAAKSGCRVDADAGPASLLLLAALALVGRRRRR